MPSVLCRSCRLALCGLLLSFFAAGCGDIAPPVGEVLAVNKNNFRSVVIRSKRPVVLEFWSRDCETCKTLEPHLAALAKEHEELVVAKIKTEQSQEIARDYGVREVPAVFILKDGDVIRRQVAPKPQELADLVAPYVTSK